MHRIHFREATIDDLDALLALEQKVIDAERPFNSSIKASDAYYYDIKNLISESRSVLIVAEYANKIIATGYSQIRSSKPSLNHENHAYLGFMFVDDQFRGRGINQSIIQSLIEWSVNQGIKDLYLDVYKDNQSAIKAYEKIGFKSSIVEMKLNIDD